MFRHVLCASLVLGVAGPASGQSLAETRVPIIDMHLHADRGTSRQDWPAVLAAMDDYRVVLAMLSVDDTTGPGWTYSSDRFWVGPAFPCHDGRFPKMDPCFAETDGWPDLQWLRRQYETGRARWMGELLQVYYGISPADPRLAVYWALAEELDVPVGIHIGRGPRPEGRAPGCCPNFNDDFGNPELLRPVLARHPGLRVWLMHAGGRDFVPETVALMKDFPNVYAEMSVVNAHAPEEVHAAGLRRFHEEGLIDRIMIGTDNLPIAEVLRRINTVPFLTVEQRAGIYCLNAARFLRIADGLCEAHQETTGRLPESLKLPSPLDSVRQLDARQRHVVESSAGPRRFGEVPG